MRSILETIRYQLEITGLKPGTPEFEAAERQEKVRLCKEMKGKDSCWNCEAFDHCQVLKAHLRDLYRVKT